MEFAEAFIGHVGFDELKKHCRQGDEFSREVISVMSERAACELQYSKSIKRLSQRLNKACSNLMTSPLSTLWKHICSQMDQEADAHKKCWSGILEETIKASSTVIDNLTKSRKNLESAVDNALKLTSDRAADHSKLKKRHHQLAKEREVLAQQLEGARPKTKNDETKLAQKQSKTEVLLSRANDEYYSALLEVQRQQTEWELTSRNSCIKMQELERCKTDHLCRIAMSFCSSLRTMSQQQLSACDQLNGHTQNLDPDGEIRVVVQNHKLTKYQSELLLCDYFYENFTNRVKEDRRVSGLTKQLEKYLGDLQKERAHKQGISNLIRAQSSRASEEDKLDMSQRLVKTSSMIRFLDINRSKLQKALKIIKGGDSSMPLHPLTDSIQQHYDKQGIIHSTVKIPFTESEEVDDVFESSNHDQGYFQRPHIQRAQSEIHRTTVDDMEIGRRGQRSRSDKGGTLTAKQLQSMQRNYYETSRKRAPAPPRNSRQSSSTTCVAKYRYDSRESDELTIQEGDVIKLIEKCDADWWKGELHGSVGIFPATYVDEVLTTEEMMV